jgi:hypothetical protein
MKTLLVVLFSVFFYLSSLAQDVTFSAEKKSAIVNNLKNGFEVNNSGLNASSAKVLYDLIDQGYLKPGDATKTMIPLLKLLDNGQSDEVRIEAALALYELGNSIGIYRLRGVAIFDDNLKVRLICKNLYYSYHKINGTEYFLNF